MVAVVGGGGGVGGGGWGCLWDTLCSSLEATSKPIQLTGSDCNTCHLHQVFCDQPAEDTRGAGEVMGDLMVQLGDQK